VPKQSAIKNNDDSSKYQISSARIEIAEN